MKSPGYFNSKNSIHLQLSVHTVKYVFHLFNNRYRGMFKKANNEHLYLVLPCRIFDFFIKSLTENDFLCSEI